MKIIRTKVFNYDLDKSINKVLDYYVDNGSQDLSDEEKKHSSPEDAVETLGKTSNSANVFNIRYDHPVSTKQEMAQVDFYASGFNYDNPEIIDPSMFHTGFKVYRNPKNPSLLVFNEDNLIKNNQEILFKDPSGKNLIFEIHSDADYFDASIEYLSENSQGYWIGPIQIDVFDDNKDYWKFSRDDAYPKVGTVMQWATIENVHKDIQIVDEDNIVLDVIDEAYGEPSKIHVQIYERDFAGIKLRKARLHIKAYNFYADNFGKYEGLDPSSRISKNEVNYTIDFTQIGTPVIFNIVGDTTFEKNGLSYFYDDSSSLKSLVDSSIQIDYLYPSYNNNEGIPYQYLGLNITTNAPIKKAEVLDFDFNSIDKSIANIYSTASNREFLNYNPIESGVNCRVYVKLKKYEITNEEAGNSLLNQPLVYRVRFMIDDGANTIYEFLIVQYGYIANEKMRCFHYYDAFNQDLTEIEKEHSTIENKLPTLAKDDSGYAYPIYITKE